MRSRALLVVVAALLSPAVNAQVVVQPTAPAVVTADNEAWFRAGEAVVYNGDLYFPVGSPQAFDPVQMVRAGAYRGISFYTMAAFEPNTILFVPMNGGRVQPYARLRQGTGLTLTPGGFVAQAPQPPLLAPPVDLIAPAQTPATPVIVGTSGRIVAISPSPAVRPRPAATPAPVGTSGRTVTVTNARAGSAAQPRGINNAWLVFNGRTWIANGKAEELTGEFTQIGTHSGFPVYTRNGDRGTIYFPSIPGLVVPFTPRSR